LRLHALLDCLLICCSIVFKTKGHDLIAVDAMGRYERRLIFVVGMHFYLVRSRVAVEEAE
jgi:hypothetical protein